MSNPAERRARESGFSLIELVVAIAVLSLAVIALLQLSAQSTRTTAHLQQQTLARLLLSNLAVEGQLGDASAGQSSGQRELAGQLWHWERQPGPALTPDRQQVLLLLRSSDGQVVASLDSWQPMP